MVPVWDYQGVIIRILLLRLTIFGHFRGLEREQRHLGAHDSDTVAVSLVPVIPTNIGTVCRSQHLIVIEVL